jgi:isopropylmalate/homocitrate/citramalate synthase
VRKQRIEGGTAIIRPSGLVKVFLYLKEVFSMGNRVYFFDTTLRDGEQTPGVNLNQDEKVEIALRLESLGIDVIEAGFAAASPGDAQAVRAVAKAVSKPVVVSLARANKADIDAVIQAIGDIENTGIHIFIATSPLHREKKLGMTKEQVIAKAVESVSFAAKYFKHIEFSCEDATRTELEFLKEICEKVIEVGATVLNLPDTVGYTTPEEYSNLFKYLMENTKGIENVRLSCHCHDDLGMALSNSIAAIQAGALQVEGCVNGIGERAGNVALEEVAALLEVRKPYYQKETGINLKVIALTSKLVCIVNDEQLNEIFKNYKDLTDRKKEIFDEDIIALLETQPTKSESASYTFKDLSLQILGDNQYRAFVHIVGSDHSIIEGEGEGNGPIDAIYKGIDSALNLDVELIDYKINSISKGKDSIGEVFVKVRDKDSLVKGRAINVDIIVASANAYIDAINRLKVKNPNYLNI